MMKFRTASILWALALLTAGAAVEAEEKAKPTALQQFESLKKLAGDWVEVGEDGKPTEKVVSSIRVTSAGSAIEETLFPGGDHEMVTMYFLDGDRLLLTHYCALGNQPQLRAEPGKDARQIAFKFIGATNLKSPDEHHMHEATLTLSGPDRYQSEWISNKEGKTCHKVQFDLMRKQQ
jgi:hypothetical protein